MESILILLSRNKILGFLAKISVIDGSRNDIAK